jgi:hypothetical protein
MAYYENWDNYVSTWRNNRDEDDYSGNKSNKNNSKKLQLNKEGGKIMSYNEPIVNCKDDDMDCVEIQSCKRTVCRAFDVFVPITVKPFASLEHPEAMCVGNAYVTDGHKCCEHDVHKEFKFTVTQRINVVLPIQYGAEICDGESCANEVGNCQNEPKGETGGQLVTQ